MLHEIEFDIYAIMRWILLKDKAIEKKNYLDKEQKKAVKTGKV